MTRDRRATHILECIICVRDRDGEDGLCKHCRSARHVAATYDKLKEFWSDEEISALVEFLDARKESEQL